MWLNAPQVEMVFARQHTSQLLIDAKQRQQFPVVSRRVAIATRLHQLAHWLTPTSANPSRETVMTVSTKRSVA